MDLFFICLEKTRRSLLKKLDGKGFYEIIMKGLIHWKVNIHNLLNKNFFKTYSLFTLIFTLLVIFWGAWVRLSFSGDACGKSWPLCNENLLPTDKSALIEWIHRSSSGLSIILIFILLVLSLKIYSPYHIVRVFSKSSFVLILIEALIGAFLVIYGLTGRNPENIRVFVLAFHLINSLLLVGSLSLCWRMSLWESYQINKPQIYFVVFFPFLALTGNIASLAGQLFPSESLFHALSLDWLPSAHISLRLRPLHPLMAISFVFVLIWSSIFKKQLRYLGIAGFIVASFGFMTLVSLSPLWMKVGHLILAYGFWVFFVCSCVRRSVQALARR